MIFGLVAIFISDFSEEIFFIYVVCLTRVSFLPNENIEGAQLDRIEKEIFSRLKSRKPPSISLGNLSETTKNFDGNMQSSNPICDGGFP
jgi:hypothetical protein